MNIARANTEPFYRFHRSKEEFTRVMRASIGALQHSMRCESAAATGLIVLPTGGEPWGDTSHFRTLHAISKETTRFLAQMGLVRVLSAFEDFLTNVKAERDRYFGLLNGSETPFSVRRTEDEESLVSLLKQCGWNMKPIGYLLPMYEYFVTMRNCVAHRASRASSGLMKQANAAKVVDSYKDWPIRSGRHLPALPTVELGREIQLLPRHAVFAGEVCYRAAKHLNSELVSFLGEDGIVYMAAYHSLFSDERILTGARHSADRIVNSVLDNRYRVTKLAKDESISILKRLGLWEKCRNRHRRLYSTTNLM
jgi:hypothetical protein